MSFLLEVSKLQKRHTLFHRKRFFWIKTILVLFTLGFGIFPLDYRTISSLTLSLFFISLILIIGGGKLLARLLILYSVLMIFILPFSLLGGASIPYIVSISIYTIATFSALTFFVASTPWSQIEEVLGDNIIVYAYRMLDLSLRDLQRVIESYAARGAEITALKPWKAVPIFISILYLTASVRITTLEDSLKARGIS